jgi:hypothetical protein
MIGSQSPAIVLVHGAFADASGFAGIIGELKGSGHDIVAPPNPLRTLSGDAAADVPDDVADVMFATQRPLSVAALTENATAAGWKSKPSWFLVSEHDNAIPPEAEKFMAQRMGATTETLRRQSAAPLPAGRSQARRGRAGPVIWSRSCPAGRPPRPAPRARPATRPCRGPARSGDRPG